jgi:hypothetical protein
MNFLTLLSLLVFAFPALADERIITIDLFKNYALFPLDAKELHIEDLRIVTEPKKIKITDDENCGDFTSSCRTRTVLEKETVVQLTLAYENNEWREDEDHMTVMRFNFPLESFSEFDLKKLKELSKSWVSRKKGLMRKEMAVRSFDLHTSMVSVSISVIDYEKSTFCHEEDRYCREKIVLKDQDVVMNKMTVTVK